MRIKLILFLSFFFLYCYQVYSQNTEIFGDSIEINLSVYQGSKIQWQFSKDKNNWTDITSSNKITLNYKIIESGYFRALVNTCEGKLYISDTTYIKAVPPKIDESFFNKEIYLGNKTPVFIKKNIRFCNVKVPNSYGQSQTHPSIVYIEKGWNGFDHWLVTTPYPGANSAYENPCIYYANSSETGMPLYDFTPILNNPIQEQPKGGFNSDPDLFFENDTLYCFFRQSQSITNFVIKKSVDGQNWTEVKTLFKSTDIQNTAAGSQAILKEDGKYKMFCCASTAWITPNGIFKKFFIVESDKIDGPYKYIGDAGFNNKGSIELWHFDIFDYQNTLYMVLCAVNNNGKSSSMSTYLAVSYDRKNFNIFPKPLFSDFCTYRPSFYINNKNKFVLYLSTNDTAASTYSVDGREIAVASMDFSDLLKTLKENR